MYVSRIRRRIPMFIVHRSCNHVHAKAHEKFKFYLWWTFKHCVFFAYFGIMNKRLRWLPGISCIPCLFLFVSRFILTTPIVYYTITHIQMISLCYTHMLHDARNRNRSPIGKLQEPFSEEKFAYTMISALEYTFYCTECLWRMIVLLVTNMHTHAPISRARMCRRRTNTKREYTNTLLQ